MKTYSVTCAACNERFLFRSLERIGLRIRKHVCVVRERESAEQVIARQRREEPWTFEQ